MAGVAESETARIRGQRHQQVNGELGNKMWLFTRYGFFSAVCARHGEGLAKDPVDSDTIMVRARVRTHLLNLSSRFFRTLQISQDDIHEYAGSDYPFRIFLDNSTWAQVVEMLVAEMDYDNFKADVAKNAHLVGHNYEKALDDVWSAMRKLQQFENTSPSVCDSDSAPVPQRTAIPQDWNNRRLPKKHAVVPLNRCFTAEEMRRIRLGVIPLQMEDKWFIYWRKNTLYFHRSWTGFCVYVVHFVKEEQLYRMFSAEVNRAPRQYSCTSDEHDAQLISWLIDVLLLGRDSRYPSEGKPSGDEAVIQWHQVGQAMFGGGGPPTIAKPVDDSPGNGG